MYAQVFFSPPSALKALMNFKDLNAEGGVFFIIFAKNLRHGFRPYMRIPSYWRPAAGNKRTDKRTSPWAEAPDFAWCDWQRKDIHYSKRHKERQLSSVSAESQQDACRPTVLGVQVVFPTQCRRILRIVLRLLPARGLPANHRHLYRKRPLDKRRD